MLKADWITTENDFEKGAPLFMREFSVEKELKSAILRISARGVYEATLNGKRIGDFVMAPGWTAYGDRIQVQEYDVTDMITNDNTLVVQLAKGWHGFFLFGQEDYKAEQPCAIIAELTLEYNDNTVDTVATDRNWKTSKSGLGYCDLYNGIIFDANVIPDFCENAVIADCNDKSVLIKQVGEKVCEQERLAVGKIIKTPKGETVLDFGQNMTGYLEITVDAKAGDRVSFSFGEMLDKDGNFYNTNYRSAKALYEYTCKDGLQTFKPNLTFYGFRYVRVDEYPAEILPRNFTAIVLHSDMRRTGKIETSDPLINQLYHNIIWGQKSNYLDVPTDCPQRDERLGWTGDAQVFMRTACYNFDVRKFFTKWLGDMKCEQGEDGHIPCVIPAVHDSRNSAAWSDAVTICTWQYYLFYGDKAMLEMMFEPMKKWVDYITNTTDKENLWFGGEHYGDWLELGRDAEYKGITRDDLIASAFYARSTEIVCKAGKVLGKDVSQYEELYKRIVNAFKVEFKDEYHTQTEHVLPLYFGLCGDKEKVIESLADMIHRDGDKLQTGFVGTPYLLHVLSDNGYTELAYKLLLRTEYPSWLYPVTKGATTMWEHWDGMKPDGEMWSAAMNSFNHYAYGAVGDWLYGVCGGIKTVEDAPAFERVCIEPVPTDKIDWFYAEVDTINGKVTSKWSHVGDRVVYEITTPVPTTAVIDGKTYELTAGTYKF